LIKRRTGKATIGIRAATAAPPVRSATCAPSACSRHAKDKHHDDCSNRGANDHTNYAAAEMKMEP
jgi:hypothetical protein